MKIICTICSKAKREGEGLMPARMRYVAPHVAAAYQTAIEQNVPFYILSGKYGIISGDTEIPNYDYYLEASEAESLSKIVAEQIKAAGITEIDFYAEQKPTWAPYMDALERGAAAAGATLRTHAL